MDEPQMEADLDKLNKFLINPRQSCTDLCYLHRNYRRSYIWHEDNDFVSLTHVKTGKVCQIRKQQWLAWEDKEKLAEFIYETKSP